MLNTERLGGKPCGAKAVFTSVGRTFRYDCSFFGGDALVHKRPLQPKLLPHFLERQAAMFREF